MNACGSIPVDESTRVGEVRRAAIALAEAAGLAAVDRARAALVATEVATNLLRHARGGEVFVRPTAGGVELLAVDRGPGLADPVLAFRDGYSTLGGAGTGLGAIRRASDVFDAHSDATGTVLLSQILPAGGRRRNRWTLGAVCRTKPGQAVCGDGWADAERAGRLRLLVCDGIGHGPAAADATREALRAFHEAVERPLDGLLGHLHEALRGTRGAAASVAEIDPAVGRLRFTGCGNVGGAVLYADDRRRGLVTTDGIVGHRMRWNRVFDYDWDADALLVVHTDGVSSRWDLATVPGLAGRHPGVVAGRLYRDHGRESDDVALVVVVGARA